MVVYTFFAYSSRTAFSAVSPEGSTFTVEILKLPFSMQHDNFVTSAKRETTKLLLSCLPT
jgi:hypothetical protein